ncbi:MAG: hypothetical protein ABIA37_00650, partial [Candidatus Woesearchaeota archaeon]
ALSITKTTSSISPQDSICGDGVVGYLDTNANGVFDTGERQEACEGTTGCNNCEYIQIGYKGTNCNFGSRTCVVTQMDPKELFVAKTNALVYGQCYPDTDHPAAMYCNNKQPELQYTNGQLNAQGKIYVVSNLAAALVKFFQSVVS